MERVQKTRTESTTETEELPDVPPSKTNPELEKHKAHTDELLDEIDALLEENAETFVKEYVQRGGQ